VQDLFSFCGFALILQLCIFLIAAVPHFRTHNQPASECVAMVLGTVMTAVPVAVPTVILGANAACMARLKQRGIDVLMVAKLKIFAAVEVVCFDKTGTLTGSVVSSLFSSDLGVQGCTLMHAARDKPSCDHAQICANHAAGSSITAKALSVRQVTTQQHRPHSVRLFFLSLTHSCKLPLPLA